MYGYGNRVAIEDLPDLPREIERLLIGALKVALRVQVESSITSVKRGKLSGQYLGVVTGTARRSWDRRYTFTKQLLSGEWGSPLRYVRAHEYGSHDRVNVRGHFRRGGVVRRAWTTKSGAVAKTKQKTRRRGAYVRPHKRVMNIRAKHFVRDTVAELRPNFGPLQEAAIEFALRHGTVPTPSDLGGRWGI